MAWDPFSNELLPEQRLEGWKEDNHVKREELPQEKRALEPWDKGTWPISGNKKPGWLEHDQSVRGKRAGRQWIRRNCVAVWILCSLVDLSKRMTYSNCLVRRPLCLEELQEETWTAAQFQSIYMVQITANSTWLGWVSRTRKGYVDVNYILEVELLGKVHHDRVLKKRLLCILASVLPYFYGT